MKTMKNFFWGAGLLLLASCSGSDFYQGEWKATGSTGEKCVIVFEANTFSITDSTGASSSYEYTQNSVSIENGVKSYGIKLSDGSLYTLTFPHADDTSVGAILDQNNYVIYTIGRNDYLGYEDLYKPGI